MNERSQSWRITKKSICRKWVLSFAFIVCECELFLIWNLTILRFSAALQISNLKKHEIKYRETNETLAAHIRMEKKHLKKVSFIIMSYLSPENQLLNAAHKLSCNFADFYFGNTIDSSLCGERYIGQRLPEQNTWFESHDGFETGTNVCSNSENFEHFACGKLFCNWYFLLRTGTKWLLRPKLRIAHLHLRLQLQRFLQLQSHLYGSTRKKRPYRSWFSTLLFSISFSSYSL